MNNLILVFLFFLFITACTKADYEKVEFEGRNPTAYLFNASVVEVKAAIEQELGNYQFRRMFLVSGNRGNAFPDSPGLLFRAGNENDYGLTNHGASIGKSVLYILGGKPVRYFAGFHIHLSEKDRVKTKVEVSAVDPRIIVGKELLPLPHGTRPAIFEKVEPSTIEEYEILLMIGKGLGHKDMPTLRKPTDSL